MREKISTFTSRKNQIVNRERKREGEESMAVFLVMPLVRNLSSPWLGKSIAFVRKIEFSLLLARLTSYTHQ